MLQVGFNPGMDQIQRMRLFAINAFVLLCLALTLTFVLAFVLMGSYSALQGLAFIPFLMLIFYLNSKSKFRAANAVVTYGMMLITLALALADRRTGTEYILIALGCCVVVVYDRLKSVIAGFTTAFVCYIIYVWYDTTHTFFPDPQLPYVLVQNTLMFLSGFVVLSQSLVFRSLIHEYAARLKVANDEVITVNEELKSSNEELTSLSESLDRLVKEKSAQLQAYIDTININLYSATADRNGTILKVNEPLLEVTGYLEDELVGQNFSLLNSGYHTQSYFENLYNTILSGRSWRGEIKNKAKDGSAFWVEMVIMPVRDFANNVSYFICLALPITDRKNAEQLQERHFKIFESIANETSHRIRGPMARIHGIINLIDADSVRKEETEWVVQKLKENILELDDATSKLTATVNKHSVKN